MGLTHILMNYVSDLFPQYRMKIKIQYLFWDRISVTYFILVLILEDVFLITTKDPKSPVIYGVFTTSRYSELI